MARGLGGNQILLALEVDYFMRFLDVHAGGVNFVLRCSYRVVQFIILFSLGTL